MLHVRDVTSCVGFSLHPHPATVIVAILNYLDGEILERRSVLGLDPVLYRKDAGTPG